MVDAPKCHFISFGGTVSEDSSYYVWDAGIDDPLDEVLEHQLAFLQPRNLELVADRLGRQRPDALVKAPVLGLEGLKVGAGFIVIHCREFTATAAAGEIGQVSTTRRTGSPSREKDQDKSANS
jgi:hypothetical protein